MTWPLPVGSVFTHRNGQEYTVTRPGMIAGKPVDYYVFAQRSGSTRSIRVGERDIAERKS